MIRTYSLTENPFIYGLRHFSYELTDVACGLEVSRYKTESINMDLFTEGRCLVLPSKTVTCIIDYDNYVALNKLENAVYYAGRTIRFFISIPGVIISIALQILACISLTFESLVAKGETLLRNCSVDDTLSCRLFNNFSFTNLFSAINYLTVFNESSCLANDLKLIGDNDRLVSFAHIYQCYLNRKLFGRT